MPGVTLTFEQRAYDDPLVAELIADLQLEYVRRYGGPDEAAVDPAEFAPPRGLLLIGLVDGAPVAMGGWRLVDESAEPVADHRPDDPHRAAEIKRMYVVASARRRGFARLMLAELERTAVAAGVDRIVLGTGIEQPEAVALYESAGYRAIDGYGHYAGAPLALFFGKVLAASGVGPE